MQVAVLADCHIDCHKHGMTAFAAWKKACLWIPENDIDVVVIAGDMFDTGHASDIAEHFATDGLTHIADSGIPVVIVVGNHEWQGATPPGGGFRRTLQVQLLDKHENIKVCADPELVDIPNSDLRIAALPWPKPGEAASSQADAAKRMADVLLNHSGPRLAVAHAAVEGATVITKRGSERDLWAVTHEPVTMLKDIDIPEALGHTALGHIHRRQNLSPTCSYIGSNEAFTFADEGQDKGFSVFRWEGGPEHRWDERQIVVGEHKFVTVTAGEEIGDLPEQVNVRMVIPAGTDRAVVAEARQTLDEQNVILRGEKHEADDPLSGEFGLEEIICDGQLAHAGMGLEDLLDIYLAREQVSDADRQSIQDKARELFST